MGGLAINEAELSIKSSSLSSVKALFISLLSGLSGENLVLFPGCYLVCGEVRELPGRGRVKKEEAE